MTESNELSEEQLFQKTVAAFKYYRTQMRQRTEKSIKFYESLPESQKSLIPDFMDNMAKIFDCIETNSQVIDLFARYKEGNDYGLFSKEYVNNNNKYNDSLQNMDWKSSQDSLKLISSSDLDKVRSTLKQFVRDWSSEGALERQLCYQPVLDEIKNIFKSSNYKKKEDFHVLVPGAGLGRLAWEIARMGFTCQGNEWSVYMLLPANYILNKCSEANILKIYPWLSQYSNNPSRDNQLAAVRFPDVNPSDIPVEANFSMAVGDFVDVYIQPENWDCIATVFFIDTAHNILDYLDTIWKILKPGGHWINLGPLLYHYSDVSEENSIELSYEELKKAIYLKGFDIISKKYPIEATYTQNRDSMLNYQYKCVYFVAQKPIITPRTTSLSSASSSKQHFFNDEIRANSHGDYK